jgi:acyl-homoserine-lactone acylase
VIGASLLMLFALAVHPGAASNAATELATQPAAVKDFARKDLRASVRRLSYGTPSIKADSLKGVGYGLGYAYAEDRLCESAQRWIVVRGELSKYFGATPTNLASDAFWQNLRQNGGLKATLSQPAPLGPLPQVKRMTAGYVRGYNQYLAETGVANLPDPKCRGEKWVTRITKNDIWLNTLHLI